MQPEVEFLTRKDLSRVKKRIKKIGILKIIITSIALLLVVILPVTICSILLFHAKRQVSEQKVLIDSLTQTNSDLRTQLTELQSKNNDLDLSNQKLQRELDEAYLNQSNASSATSSVPSISRTCGETPSITSTKEESDKWFNCRASWYHRYLPGQKIP